MEKDTQQINDYFLINSSYNSTYIMCSVVQLMYNKLDSFTNFEEHKEKKEGVKVVKKRLRNII